MHRGLIPPFQPQKKILRILYGSMFFFSFHAYIFLYIQSTFISKYVSENYLINHRFFLNKLLKNLIRNYNKLLNNGYYELLAKYIEKSAILGKHVEIYKDDKFENNLIAKGKVLKIGDELEIYIEGHEHPVKEGRLIIID